MPAAGHALWDERGSEMEQQLSKEVARTSAYPPVEGERLSQEYRVSVNGKEVPVYTACLDKEYRNSPLDMDDAYSFASFDFAGEANVSIESKVPLASLSIRPGGEDIPVALQGHTATFSLNRNGNLLIERNGNGRKDPLLLFANPLEEAVPDADDPDVIYFGPGRHDAGLITLTSSQTLYIDGGAVVTGRVEARGENISIRGRGLLENSAQEYYGKHMIVFEDSQAARVEGIILRKNSQHWTLATKRCDDVTISNVKICGSFYGNDDGIDPVNTRNMLIEDCFIRTKDDCLAFKGMDDERSNCENITVTRTMMWSDQCCCILLGDESRADYMRNITIKDCFVPYLSYEGYPKKLLMLHAGEDMVLEDIRLENIEVGGEGQERNYIEMSCEYNQYSKTETAGHIRNIVLKNIHLTGDKGGYFILLKGHDPEHCIADVTFEACTINGKSLDSDYPNLQIGEFVRDIRFC